MKKAISWPASWLLYYLGYGFGRLLHLVPDDCCDWGNWTYRLLYKPYNNLMGWSLEVQDWGGLIKGPWQKP